MGVGWSVGAVGVVRPGVFVVNYSDGMFDDTSDGVVVVVG